MEFFMSDGCGCDYLVDGVKMIAIREQNIKNNTNVQEKENKTYLL